MIVLLFIYISLLRDSLISGYVYPGYGFLPPLNASTPLIIRTGCPLLWPNDGSLLCENGGFMYNYSVSQAKADFIYNLFQSSPDPVLYDFLLDNKTQNNFYFDEPGYIEFTIVGESAGYHNAIGLFMFNASSNSSVISQSLTDVWRDFSTQASKDFVFGHQRGDTVRLGPFPAKSNVGLYVVSDRNRLGIWWNSPDSCINNEASISSCISTFDFKNNSDYLYCYSKYDCILDSNLIFAQRPAALKYSIDSLNLKYNPAAYSQIPYRHFRMIKDAVTDEIYISFNDWTEKFGTSGTMIIRVSRPQPHLPKLCSSVCNPAHGSCNFTTGTCACQSGFGGADCSCVAPIGTCANAQLQPNTYNCATGQCNCLAGWKGNLCDCKEVCEKNCQNGGTCLCDGTCGCIADWRGSADCSCRTPISEVCKNSMPSPNRYICTTGACNCLPGWSGDLCDTIESTDTTPMPITSTRGIFSVSSISITPYTTTEIIVSGTTSGISSSESQSNSFVYLLIGTAGGAFIVVIGTGILIYRCKWKRRQPFQSANQSSYSLKASSMNLQLINPGKMKSFGPQQLLSNSNYNLIVPSGTPKNNNSNSASTFTKRVPGSDKDNFPTSSYDPTNQTTQNISTSPLCLPGYSILKLGIDFVLPGRMDKLGKGGTGSIFGATLINPKLVEKHGLTNVAVKIFPEDTTDFSSSFAHYEIAIMNLIPPNPHVVKFIGYMETPHCAIIMKQYEGSLHSLIKDKIIANDPIFCLKIARDVVSGMKLIHGMNVLHLDIKPHNILWERLQDGNLNFCICDFGFASLVGESRSIVSGLQVPKSVGITVRYTAPEVFARLAMPSNSGRVNTDLDKKIDVFAFGMTMYSVMSGASFWKDLEYAEIVSKILNGDRPSMEFLTSEMVTHAKSLINIVKECWKQNPTDRPTFSDISSILFINVVKESWRH